jgi:hypothetical protein
MNFSVIIDKLRQYPVAVICAVILLLLVFIVFLRGSVTSDLSVQESDLNSRIRTISENIKNAKGLKQDTEKLDAMVEQIDLSLFNRYERAININFFYGLEDMAGVVISNIGQLSESDAIYAKGGARKLELYSTLVYSINVSGSFSNILKFLYELDRVDPLIRVAEFNVSREGGVLGGANVDARLRVLVLAKKD